MSLWPTRSIPPRPPADPSDGLRDSEEQARFIATIEERTARQRERERERERRERREAEGIRPPPPPPVQTQPPPRNLAPRTPPRPPPRLMPGPEPSSRDLLDVAGRRDGRQGASSVDGTGRLGALAPLSPVGGTVSGAARVARLSDAVPPEAKARIEDWLRTGRIDDRPFSFTPLDPLAQDPGPSPARARPPLEPPRDLFSAPLPIGPPETAVPAPKAGPEAPPRLPFEEPLSGGMAGNRYDLLPVSLPAVTLARRSR